MSRETCCCEGEARPALRPGRRGPTPSAWLEDSDLAPGGLWAPARKIWVREPDAGPRKEGPYWPPGLARELERGAHRRTTGKKCPAEKQRQGPLIPSVGSPSPRGSPQVWMSTDSILNVTHLMIPRPRFLLFFFLATELQVAHGCPVELCISQFSSQLDVTI